MYNDIIVEHFSDPKHVGDLEAPDVEYQTGNPVCGDRLRIQLRLTGDTVSAACFRAWGCATSVATGDIFCESILGQPLTAIAQRTAADWSPLLGELAPAQQHCLDILAELHHTLMAQVTAETIA